MMRRSLPVLLFVVCSLSSAPFAFAQAEPYNLAASPAKVSDVFATLFGPHGLTVDSEADLGDGTPHNAHFNNAFQSEFGQFGSAIARKLVSVPLPSPASSVVYEYNAAGDLVRSQKSFGPILAERTETVGVHRTSVGFAYQRFSFSSVEGLDLNALPAIFSHDGALETTARADVVRTVNQIEASVSQFTTFVTYGLSDRFDISLAVPIVTTSVAVRSDAEILRLGSTNPAIHFFRQSDGSFGVGRTFTSSARASGVGDITVRAKSRVRSWGSSAVGLGVDLRIPTGDEENLLGAGAAGVRPFAIWSGTYGVVSPHVNLGYLWNGSSPLAGTTETGGPRSLPDQILLTTGADLRLGARATVAFDVFGEHVNSAPRLVPGTFRRGDVALPSIEFARRSFTEWNAAAGMKLLVAPDLLLNANVLFRLDESGLRSRATALIGLGYSL